MKSFRFIVIYFNIGLQRKEPEVNYIEEVRSYFLFHKPKYKKFAFEWELKPIIQIGKTS